MDQTDTGTVEESNGIINAGRRFIAIGKYKSATQLMLNSYSIARFKKIKTLTL